MFLMNFFKKLQLEQEKITILKERDEAFNAIGFKSGLEEAITYLHFASNVTNEQLGSIIDRLSKGLPDGKHFIDDYEITVSSSRTGLKSVKRKRLDDV